MYVLPSLFTCANVAAGYYAILQAVQGSAFEPRHFDNAAIAIGLAILFDGLDGRIARMTRTESEFGRELDSLADVLTFGIAPAVLAYMWGFRMLPGMENGALQQRVLDMGVISTFLFLIAGASRLARFNISKDPKPSNPGRPERKYFVGLPIPAGAGVIAAVVHFTEGMAVWNWKLSIAWAIFVSITGFLMVSTWRFRSFKELDLRERAPFQIIVVIGLLIAAITYFSGEVLLFVGVSYMLSGLLFGLSYTFRRRRAEPVYESKSPA